jgi:hypothetical protein
MTLVLVLALIVVCMATEGTRITKHLDLLAAELHARIAKLEKNDG